MIYRHCPRCGARLPVGERCPCVARAEAARQRSYDRERRNKQRADFYASRPWKQIQHDAKARYAGLDVYALYEHGAVRPGRLAHHIIPLEDDWEKRFDLDNIVFVSDASHREIHEAYGSGKQAKQMMQRKLKAFQERWKDGAAPVDGGNATLGGGEKSI